MRDKNGKRAFDKAKTSRIQYLLSSAALDQRMSTNFRSLKGSVRSLSSRRSYDQLSPVRKSSVEQRLKNMARPPRFSTSATRASSPNRGGSITKHQLGNFNSPSKFRNDSIEEEPE